MSKSRDQIWYDVEQPREVCNHYHVTGKDYEMARQIVGSGYKTVDLVIAPDAARISTAGTSSHTTRLATSISTSGCHDPERPLHDHPWANQSVILAGAGYVKDYANIDNDGHIMPAHIRWGFIGDTIQRPADQAHRLTMMPGEKHYTMTLFSTGPKIRKWGFWYPEGWVDADDVCKLEGNVSTHVKR